MLFLLLVLKDFFSFNTIGFTCYFDDVLIEELEAFGGVLITVPKWCGKATSDSQLAISSLFMHDKDSRESNIHMAKTKPSILLRGDGPRLIDEW